MLTALIWSKMLNFFLYIVFKTKQNKKDRVCHFFMFVKEAPFSPRLHLFGQKHCKYSKSSNIVYKLTKINSLWSDFLKPLMLTKTALT